MSDLSYFIDDAIPGWDTKWWFLKIDLHKAFIIEKSMIRSRYISNILELSDNGSPFKD